MQLISGACKIQQMWMPDGTETLIERAINFGCLGSTENAGPENEGPKKQDWNMQDQ